MCCNCCHSKKQKIFFLSLRLLLSYALYTYYMLITIVTIEIFNLTSECKLTFHGYTCIKRRRRRRRQWRKKREKEMIFRLNSYSCECVWQISMCKCIQSVLGNIVQDELNITVQLMTLTHTQHIRYAKVNSKCGVLYHLLLVISFPLLLCLSLTSFVQVNPVAWKSVTERAQSAQR